jgi:class 3 adenylate cyclase/tetratricopeptide (TPR) repeat protein
MVRCSACGRAAEQDAQVCSACGALLGGSAVPRRQARKLATVVFSDVTGFTALGERLDPESVQHVMTRYFAAMRPAVERHGGTVERYLGDAIMAVFGVPRVHEDDALRAARAACEMRASLGVLNQELDARWEVRLATHTGINTGEVVCGTSAEGQPMTYGDAVNVAQRIESEAAPEEILVGPTTARLLRGKARLSPVAPLMLKGKSSLVEAWRLESLDPAARDGSGHAAARPLAGRRAELRALLQAFRATVSSKQPRLVTLVGSAGIGKSRLYEVLLEETAEDAAAVMGRCLPYGEGITYWPLAEIVRALAGSPTEAAIAEVAGGGGEGARIAALVARITGFAPGGAALEEAHWAVRRVLERCAAERPLIVAVDDLQWAEPTLLDLLEHVVTFATGVPLLLVGLARPELLARRPAWDRVGGRSAIVHLGPLPEADAEALLLRLTAGAPDDRDGALLRTAEGNPFFIEQLVAMRAESGDAPTAPPPTIQAVLAARIDALPPPERAVVDAAAVEGRNFHRDAVADLLRPSQRADLDGSLAVLVQRELVRPSPPELPGEVGYRFAHMLVRDVAYGLLAKGTRTELHERHAKWLEDRAGGAPPEVVGYHLEQAHRCHAELHPGAGAERRGLGTRAARRLGAAGRAAVEHGDLPAAVGLLERASALLAEDDPMRLAFQPELGMALVHLGRLEQADDVLTAAAARAAACGDTLAEAHATTARFFALCQLDSAAAASDLDRRFDHLEWIFTDRADELGLARLWRAEALVHWLAGRSARAKEAWTRGIRHARRAGDEHGAHDGLCWLASAACAGPTPVPSAISRCETILERLSDDRGSRALVMRPLASLHAMAGRFDRARKLFAEATAILDDLGAGLTSAACDEEAFVALLSGDPVLAESILRAGYARLDAMGEHALLATTAAMLARALEQQGRLREAWSMAGAAQTAAAADDMSVEIVCKAVRAQILAARGAIEQARTLSAEAVASAARTDWLTDHADALMAQADVLDAAGSADDAMTAIRSAWELYERKGNVVSAARAETALATAAAAETKDNRRE